MMVETTFNIKNTDIADLFTKDLITMEDIVDKLLEQDDKIQELEYENEDLRDELRSQEQIKEDFYTPKSSYEVYGVSPRDFV